MPHALPAPSAAAPPRPLPSSSHCGSRPPAWYTPCGRGWRVHRVGGASAAQDPLGLDIEGIHRLARRHEQPVALRAAETHVGAALRQQDAADHRAVGGVDGDPVLGLAAGPGAPEVAVRVDPQAVAATRLGATELAPVGYLGAIIDYIVDLDRP